MATTKRSSPKRSPVKRGATAAPSRRKVPTVKPAESATLRARYVKHLAEFRRARVDEVSRWDAAFEALAPILGGDPPLYLAGGYKSARAFVAAEIPGMDIGTVRDYVRVATHFDPETEARFGVSKLALLLDYLQVKGGGELPRARIDPERTRVTVGGVTRPFGEMTFDGMRDAVRGARRGQGPGRTDSPEVRALRAVLDTRGLGNLSVTYGAGRYTIGRIEARQFKDLAAALARVKPVKK